MRFWFSFCWAMAWMQIIIRLKVANRCPCINAYEVMK